MFSLTTGLVGAGLSVVGLCGLLRVDGLEGVEGLLGAEDLDGAAGREGAPGRTGAGFVGPFFSSDLLSNKGSSSCTYT